MNKIVVCTSLMASIVIIVIFSAATAALILRMSVEII